MVRQGDILLLLVGRVLPPSARPIARESGVVVLAHGEATGHRHQIRSPHAALFAIGEERLLRVEGEAELEHEEHASIRLPAGVYRIVQQREYAPYARTEYVED
jgi:hypothetical protein